MGCDGDGEGSSGRGTGGERFAHVLERSCPKAGTLSSARLFFSLLDTCTFVEPSVGLRPTLESLPHARPAQRLAAVRSPSCD